jgi:serine/threonine-protein kinase
VGRLPQIDERIRLKREMARGGMGVVYEARHAFLDRPVAVKLVRDGLSHGHTETARLRLAREAKILARLDHPNIVRVLDSGYVVGEGPYVVLEKLDGRTLAGLVAVRGKLSLEVVCGFASALAAALDYAHRRGVVHRDIKPQNVFVVGGVNIEASSVKLIDFGIASLGQEGAGADMGLTRQGEFLGTLDYVAPEQLRDVGNPSPLSDQYSFAAMLFECLTGAPPGWQERSSPTGLETLCERLPEPMRKPIFRAMHPDAAARYPRMSDLLQDLDAIRRSLGIGHEITERPPEPTRRKHVRAPYTTPLRIRRENGENVDGRSEDISEGGLLVIIPTPLASGERVEVRFALPTSGRMVRLSAVARWTKESRGRAAIGLGFELDSPDAAADVARYVALMGSEAAPVI